MLHMPLPRATILVVDDEPSVCAFLDRALTSAGWQVVIADDGLTALVCLKQTPIDVVLCDAVMPQMDGLALCMRVRADPALAHLPIIVMSAAADFQAFPPALATAVMRKPLSLDALLAHLRCWLVPTALPRQRARG